MESEAMPCDQPSSSLTPPFTQSTSQKERPNLSLNLRSIDLRADCQKSTPGPTTASILQKIEKVAPDLKEIFSHINDTHTHASGSDQLNTHLSSLDSTAVSNVPDHNLFDECFKTASSQRLHLNVSPSLASKDQSLETPALNLVSPMKGPNLLNAKTLTCEPSSINDANNCSDINEEKDNNNTSSPRKRGRPPKIVTKSSTHSNNGCLNDNESKKLRDRERNRQAAINYRRNQRDWVREISTRVRMLEAKNVTLEAQLTTAQRRIQHLEGEIDRLIKSDKQSTKLIYKCLVPSVIVSEPNDQASPPQ